MNTTLPQKDDFWSVPVFDSERALSRVHQKQELLKRVIDIFIKSLSERIDIIENEICNENWDKLETMAHSIKGSSWTIGAQQLGDIAYAMEKAASNEDMTLLVHLFQIFKEASKRFIEYEKEMRF